MARRSVATTEKPEDVGVRSLYAPMWVLVFIWGGALLVLIGAGLLYSFVHEGDWRVCATLCVILLLALVILLVCSFLCRQGLALPFTSSSALDSAKKATTWIRKLRLRTSLEMLELLLV